MTEGDFICVLFSGVGAYSCLRILIDGSYPVTISISVSFLGSESEDYLISRENQPVKYWLGFGLFLTMMIVFGLIASQRILGWPGNAYLHWLANPDTWSPDWH